MNMKAIYLSALMMVSVPAIAQQELVITSGGVQRLMDMGTQQVTVTHQPAMYRHAPVQPAVATYSVANPSRTAASPVSMPAQIMSDVSRNATNTTQRTITYELNRTITNAIRETIRF